MVWISKPSGSMKVERRDEPYITPEMKRHIESDILPRYPQKRAALLPVLHEIQHHHNWIPAQALEEAAAIVGCSPVEALDTASFYEEFFLQPKGKYLLQICRSIACELCGEVPLLARLEQKLGIVDTETTDDDKITLMTVECLGACDFAPAVMINGRLYQKLTWEKLEEIIDGLPDDPRKFDPRKEDSGIPH